MQNYLLEEGTDEMTLFLESGSTDLCAGNRSSPLVKQLVEYRGLLDKFVRKGINEELVRVLLRLGIRGGIEDLERLAPRIGKYCQRL